MSKITIARPYAKAAFNFANENQDVEYWLSMLLFSAEVIRSNYITKLLSNYISHKKLAQIFIMICGDQLNDNGKNLIRIMAEKKRLTILPYVLDQFVDLLTAQKLTIKVDIISSYVLQKKQLLKISSAIEYRFLCKASLNCKIDKSILGGIIICIGDMVIDGSIRSRFNRLSGVLQT